ncbi:MAG: hypothetical protein KA419_10085 [Acidobacteria bacterium]|nr:hypothetical protein [Acidobacteriota bacterium]
MKKLTKSMILEASGTLVRTLRGRLGDGLVSAALYGSTVRGDFDPERSDVNMLLVVADANPATLDALAEPLQAARIAFRCAPFVIGREEICRSLDVYAVKFLEMQRACEVLDGADPLAGLTMPPGAVRRESERELRNITFKLRRAYLALRPDSAALVGTLRQFLPPLTAIVHRWVDYRSVERHGGDFIDAAARHYGFEARTYRDLLALRHRPATPWPTVEDAYHFLFVFLEKITAEVDEEGPGK